MLNHPNGKKKVVFIAAAALLALPTAIYFSRHHTQTQHPAATEGAPVTGEVTGGAPVQSPDSIQNSATSVEPAGTTESSNQETDVASRSAHDTGKIQDTGPGVSSGVGVAVGSGGAGMVSGTEHSKSAGHSQAKNSAPGTEGTYLPTQGALSRVLSFFSLGSPSKSASPMGAGKTSDAARALAPMTGGARDTTVVMAPVVKPEPIPTEGCVTVTFQRKKNAGCSSDEGCTQMRNIIRLKHENPRALCVRVNKTPVKFELVKGKTDEYLIGPVAGLKAEITARYCFGKSTCHENCQVPKDDFMDAIGGSGENFQPSHVAHWEGHDKAEKDSDVGAHLDSEMKKELDRLDAPEQTAQIFQDWIRGNETPACGSRGVANATQMLGNPVN